MFCYATISIVFKLCEGKKEEKIIWKSRLIVCKRIFPVAHCILLKKNWEKQNEENALYVCFFRINLTEKELVRIPYFRVYMKGRNKNTYFVFFQIFFIFVSLFFFALLSISKDFLRKCYLQTFLEMPRTPTLHTNRFFLRYNVPMFGNCDGKSANILSIK